MKPKIIFMGTPDFATPSLQALIDEGFDIQLVVTQPDRPSGRGQKLTPPPIKVLAQQNQIEVLQPESLRRDELSRKKILETECDFLIVVAFGQILPKEILDHPKVAPLNVHASLLPAYRGAAPIARSIMQSETETGVSIQWMVEELDMGDVLFQLPCRIEESDTSANLHDHLKTLGAQALISCLSLFERHQIQRRAQDRRVGSYAEKLQKLEAKISFDQPAHELHRKIMGMNPWPVAECQLLGQRLRIFKTEFVARQTDAEPGTIVDVGADELIVACLDGCIGILELQLESRKRLPTKEFLKGMSVPVGLILGTEN